MKIAICLYGLSPFDARRYGNTFPYNQKIDNVYTFNNESYFSLKSWKEHIIYNNVVDFFVHQWTTDQQKIKKFLEIFNPKDYIFEDIIITKDIIKSQSLSIKEVTDLLSKYENLNEFEYDLVILCRPDVIWMRNIDIQNTYDPNKFTVTYWGNLENLNATWDTYNGTNDIIFVSNSKNIKLYSTLYDKLDDYRKSDESDGYDHHSVKKHHIVKSKLIDIIDFKLVVDKDLILETRCNKSHNAIYIEPNILPIIHIEQQTASNKIRRFVWNRNAKL